MTGRRRIGMLTPSSNTVLEPVSSAMVAGLDEVSLHFARFRVLEISLGEAALGQFDTAPMLAAAELLADARVDAICWNGTSAGWLGLEADRRLCAQIEDRTGIPATSAVLSLVDLFRRAAVERYALVSPYTEDVQKKIVETFAAEGFTCTAERHAGESRNFHFADITPEAIRRMIEEVAGSRPQAVVVLCTNMDGATPAAAIETAGGPLVFDSIAAAMWGAIRRTGIDPARLSHWGRLFTL